MCTGLHRVYSKKRSREIKTNDCYTGEDYRGKMIRIQTWIQRQNIDPVQSIKRRKEEEENKKSESILFVCSLRKWKSLFMYITAYTKQHLRIKLNT